MLHLSLFNIIKWSRIHDAWIKEALIFTFRYHRESAKSLFDLLHVHAVFTIKFIYDILDKLHKYEYEIAIFWFFRYQKLIWDRQHSYSQVSLRNDTYCLSQTRQVWCIKHNFIEHCFHFIEHRTFHCDIMKLLSTRFSSSSEHVRAREPASRNKGR